jgi:hypothetical protein
MGAMLCGLDAGKDRTGWAGGSGRGGATSASTAGGLRCTSVARRRAVVGGRADSGAAAFRAAPRCGW